MDRMLILLIGKIIVVPDCEVVEVLEVLGLEASEEQ